MSSSPPKPPRSGSKTSIDINTQQLQREIIELKVSLLESGDNLDRSNCEKADVISLLGSAELLLEEKIAYIIELDRSLSERIRELEAECDRKTEEIENRGKALSDARDEDRKTREARDAVIGDLNARLEKANQETNQAHQVAGDINRELTKSTEEAARLRAGIDQLEHQLSQEREAAKALQAKLEDLDSRHSDKEAALQESQKSLQASREETKAAQAIIDQIQDSSLWRWSKWWRSWFGPKV